MMLALELAEVGRHVVLIEGVDLRLRGGVLVGHGPVGDAGVHHGHVQAAVAGHRGDRLELHAPVDGLGGEGVPQLVGVNVAQSGCSGDAAHDSADLGPPRWSCA